MTGLLGGLGGVGAHFLDEGELRGRVAGFCRSHEGLRSSGLTSGAYAELMFPHDRPAWRERAADEMYSCALRYLAVMRALGLRHRVLAEPYERRVGLAMSDVEAVARAHDALVIGEAVASYVPQAGDAMLAGSGNALHCSCIVAVTDGWDLECVDGGQGTRGDMAVEPSHYELQQGISSAFVRSIEPPRYSLAKPGPVRHLRSFVNLWALVEGAGLLEA